MKYDYLIVGSGLFGSVFAYEANKRGKRCLVIEKRDHIGGNIYSYEQEGIEVHKYGAHIFHTSMEHIWNYINQFSDFNRFTNMPIANYKGEIYNMPFNMNTFNKIWGVITPEEAQIKIRSQIMNNKLETPKNLEEQALSLVGKDIYEKLIKGYTEKQWGRRCDQLPAFIINRLPIRFTYDNNYFNDNFQGIPTEGYTKIIEKMLKNIEVRLNYDFFENKEYLLSISNKVLFTGMIDQFYDYCLGELEYRSLKFENECLNQENYQGSAVVNFTDNETPFTRIIEHKHFMFGKQHKTVITKEYPIIWKKGEEPYYPINDEKNNKLYNCYKEISKKENNVIFGGRLGLYKYYDMDDTIQAALDCVENEFYI